MKFWILNRLRAMSAAEIAHRTKTALVTRLERTGVGLARPRSPSGSCGRPWIRSLPQPSADAPLYCAEADRIISGRFRIFSIPSAECGFPPKWNRDPKTGITAPMGFGKSINYRREELVGDIKYLWEPNRHLELVTLAQAWHLTNRPDYLVASRTMLESWFDQCPYPQGVNWTSSLEVGIRLLNWAVSWHLLGGEESPIFETNAGERFKRRWLDSVYQHCHFISNHQSLHSSANNHLLGEHLGLFVGALTWPLWRKSKNWAEKAHSEFEAEALLQNYEDGVNKEQGIWYHHEVADMMLLALLFGRENGYAFGDDYLRRWETMLDFIASLMDVAGNVPSIGDADDAVMVRFDPTDDFHAYRSLLATGAVLCNRPDFKAKALFFDHKSRWLLGDLAVGIFDSLPAQNCPPRRSFPEGGYYILGSDFDTPDEVRIVADAGPLGYLSIAAHGHADALSFSLSVHGQPLLIDPGTYAYHTNKKWRDYFRGTSAHNTVRVDEQDQSLAGGNFLWLKHAKATCENFSIGEVDDFVANHTGYLRLPDPVLHRRRLKYTAVENHLSVEDTMECRDTHRIEIFWHFDPTCGVELVSASVRVTSSTCALFLKWPAGFRGEIFCASEIPALGWISKGFDRKSACNTLRITGEIHGNWRGVTEIHWSKA